MKRASGASFVSIILLLCMDASSPVLTHHNFTLIAHTAMLSKCDSISHNKRDRWVPEAYLMIRR